MSCLIKFFILLFFGSGFSKVLRTRIIKTSVFGFFPELKEHHVVVVEQHNRILYAVDFTPLRQSSCEILTSLLLARDVPAEVRVKFLTNVDFYDDSGILSQWMSKPCVSSGSVIFPCLDRWDHRFMNLYFHNCQHFSAFFVGDVV